MTAAQLSYLRCPECSGTFEGAEDTIVCKANHRYPVVRGVPRFVPEGHYSSSFGWQWEQYAYTQYDSRSGKGVSRKRLFKETRWPEAMEGETILEAGCGSGRFTEQLLSTGATVISVDASSAVDANFRAHGSNERSLILQADINRLPLAHSSFDRVLCIGVLQHTPDPFATFAALVKMAKPGGAVAVDIYDKAPWYKRILNTRHWIRPLTSRMNLVLLHRVVRGYVHLVWPVAKLIHRLPGGWRINHKLLIAEHLSFAELSEEAQKDWAVLDTFDWLSPRYELSQTIPTVQGWCARLPLKEVDITPGYGGIEVRALKA